MSKWQQVKIGELCRIEKGKTGIQKAIPGNYPLVVTSKERKSHNDYQFDTSAVCIPLVSSTGHGKKSLKNIHYQEGKFALGTILCAVIPNDFQILNPRFLHLFLHQNKDKVLVPLMRGAANVSLSIKDIKNVEIPLPTIDIQEKIIQKFEKIDTDVNIINKQLTKQQTYIQKLRQQILQEAIQGKLTEEWRRQNPDVEPASELLKRIKAEKEKLVEEGKIKKGKPLPPIKEEEKPFELPDGWVWCRLGEVGLFNRGKSKHRPRNDEKLFVNGKYPFVQTGDIAQSKLTNYNIYTCTGYYNDYGLNQSKMWRAGTLCITIAANIAETGFLTFNACFPDSVVGFKSLTNEYLPKHIRFFIEATKNELLKYAPATAQKNINLGIINKLAFPLPPEREIVKITEKVENIINQSIELQEQTEKNGQYADKLMQVVLREAFESN